MSESRINVTEFENSWCWGSSARTDRSVADFRIVYSRRANHFFNIRLALEDSLVRCNLSNYVFPWRARTWRRTRNFNPAIYPLLTYTYSCLHSSYFSHQLSFSLSLSLSLTHSLSPFLSLFYLVSYSGSICLFFSVTLRSDIADVRGWSCSTYIAKYVS